MIVIICYCFVYRNFWLNMEASISFVVVFPALPVIAIILVFNLLRQTFAKSPKAAVVSLTVTTGILKLLNLLALASSIIIAEAPAFIASQIKSCPLNCYLLLWR